MVEGAPKTPSPNDNNDAPKNLSRRRLLGWLGAGAATAAVGGAAYLGKDLPGKAIDALNENAQENQIIRLSEQAKILERTKGNLQTKEPLVKSWLDDAVTPSPGKSIEAEQSQYRVSNMTAYAFLSEVEKYNTEVKKYNDERSRSTFSEAVLSRRPLPPERIEEFVVTRLSKEEITRIQEFGKRNWHMV